MVSHISWRSAGVYALPNPLQHLSGGYHDTRPRELGPTTAPSALGVVISQTSVLPMTLMVSQQRKAN